MSYGNIIVRLIFNIQLFEIIVCTRARVLKTTEAAASVASNVATAMVLQCYESNVHPLLRLFLDWLQKLQFEVECRVTQVSADRLQSSCHRLTADINSNMK